MLIHLTSLSSTENLDKNLESRKYSININIGSSESGTKIEFWLGGTKTDFYNGKRIKAKRYLWQIKTFCLFVRCK